VYLVLEHADGGMLYQHLMSLKDRKMTERDAARVTQQVASALDYLHSINVMHRDLKPENILLAAIPGAPAAGTIGPSGNPVEMMDRFTVKVCDFGWSVPMKVDSRRVTLCGTVEYLPPEVASGDQYDFGFDMWTLGILVFEMLAGYSPFSLTQDEVALYGHDPEAANALIVKKIGELTFSIPSHFTRAAADLVKRLLKGSGEARLSPQQVLNHPWITRHCGPYTATTGAAADVPLVMATGGTIAPWDNSAIPVPPTNAAAVLLASSAPTFSRDPHALQASLAAFDARQNVLSSSKAIQAPSVKSLIQRKASESDELVEAYRAQLSEMELPTTEEGGDAASAPLPDIVSALLTAHADGVLPSSVLEEMRALSMTTSGSTSNGGNGRPPRAKSIFDGAGAEELAPMLSPVRPNSGAGASRVPYTPSSVAGTAVNGTASKGTVSKAGRTMMIPSTPRGVTGAFPTSGMVGALPFTVAPGHSAAATPKSTGKKKARGGGSAAKRVMAGPQVPIPEELLRECAE
jgi:serine/threonine protein kinase